MTIDFRCIGKLNDGILSPKVAGRLRSWGLAVEAVQVNHGSKDAASDQ